MATAELKRIVEDLKAELKNVRASKAEFDQRNGELEEQTAGSCRELWKLNG